MFKLTAQQALLIGSVVAPMLFAICTYFTRANIRRVISALAGGVAYGSINYGWDEVAIRFGWWSYPGWLAKGHGPLALYLLASIVGSGMGLIGWRIVRRWGWKGLVGFLLFWAAYGIVHDYGGSQAFASSQLMVFGSGLLPIIADMLWYVTGYVAMLFAIRLFGGPFGVDTLARTKLVAVKSE